MEKGKEAVDALLKDGKGADGSEVWDRLFDGVLGDRAKVMEESRLPQTGMPASVEQELSSIFVEPCQLQVLDTSISFPACPHDVAAQHSTRCVDDAVSSSQEKAAAEIALIKADAVPDLASSLACVLMSRPAPPSPLLLQG